MAPQARKERLLVCNCQKTMHIDGRGLADALGLSAPLVIQSELCRGQIGTFEAALASGDDLHVACTQEAPLFREVAQEKVPEGAPTLRFTNIRERAGWCSGRSQVQAKMAALLAEAAHDAEPTGVATLKSEGVCLVYGGGQEAIDVAQALSQRLSVTVVLTDPSDALPPGTASVPIYKGRITKATGHLGAFEIEVDGYAPMLPSSKATLEFVLPRNNARSRCDLIFDMSGGSPLFSDSSRRDGYVRVDPSQPAAIARAMFDIADLVGDFEKPLYVSYDAAVCAHARSQKVGCTNCLDNCPTGAIAPDGDRVVIDAAVCGGCGNCAALCPTEAITYTYPQRQDLLTRLEVLLQVYQQAGGTRAVLLLHDDKHGAPLISAMSRLGRGLPPNVLPLSLFSVHQLGHETMAVALALGAEHVVILTSPQHPEEQAALHSQTALMDSFLDGLGYPGRRVHLMVDADPDIVEEHLYELSAHDSIPVESFSVLGAKREVARLALSKLKAAAPAPKEVIPLPTGAPYGRLKVDVDGCTLCLSCVGACPTGALSDNPDRPQVSFTEAVCVQCGICVATCPENVIRLEPRYNFDPSALRPDIIKREEPFHCVSCGKPFGTKSTVERVLAKLKGKHAMFQTDAQLRLIQMCDTCRVVAVAEEGNDPFRGRPRPRIRTTDDYIDGDEPP